MKLIIPGTPGVLFEVQSEAAIHPGFDGLEFLPELECFAGGVGLANGGDHVHGCGPERGDNAAHGSASGSDQSEQPRKRELRSACIDRSLNRRGGRRRVRLFVRGVGPNRSSRSRIVRRHWETVAAYHSPRGPHEQSPQ